MARNSLYPASVTINYHSVYGAHKMTIPTTAWSAGLGTNGYGGWLGTDGTTVCDALDTLTELCDLIKPFMIATSAFDVATIYTYADPEANAEPHAIVPLSIDGTGTTTLTTKATMQTWNFRTTDFGKFKLVLLDGIMATSFDKVLPVDFSAADLAIVGSLTDGANPWLGRDTAPIGAAVSKTFKISDALRKAYGMG